MEEKHILNINLQTDLQEAIDSAQPYTTLIIPAGVRKQNIQITKSIKIVGQKKAILDGGNYSPVILINGDDLEVELENLQFMHGRMDFGGGVCIYGKSHIVIKHCNIINNQALSSGGGIFISEADVNIMHTTFAENTATRGGALALMNSSKVRIYDSEITNNNADIGGGIFVQDGSSLFMDQTRLIGNSFLEKTSEGSALYIAGSKTQKPHVELLSCQITPNSYIPEIAFGKYSGVLEMSNCSAPIASKTLITNPGQNNFLNPPPHTPGDGFYLDEMGFDAVIAYNQIVKSNDKIYPILEKELAKLQLLGYAEVNETGQIVPLQELSNAVCIISKPKLMLHSFIRNYTQSTPVVEKRMSISLGDKQAVEHQYTNRGNHFIQPQNIEEVDSIIFNYFNLSESSKGYSPNISFNVPLHIVINLFSAYPHTSPDWELETAQTNEFKELLSFIKSIFILGMEKPENSPLPLMAVLLTSKGSVKVGFQRSAENLVNFESQSFKNIEEKMSQILNKILKLVK